MNESQQIDVLSAGAPVPARYHVIENPNYRSWIVAASDRLCTAAGHTRTVDGSACVTCYEAAVTYAQSHAPADRVMSNTSINMQRYTWKQLAEHCHERASNSEQLVTVLFDLDRCEHGRHERDDCFDCKGPSRGNPVTRGEPQRVVRVDDRPLLGYGINGDPIIMPKTDLRNPEAWRARS